MNVYSGQESSIQPGEVTVHPLNAWQEIIWFLIALLTPLFVNLWVEQQFEASKVWLLRSLVWVLLLLWIGGWLAGLRHRSIPQPTRTLIIILVLILLLSTAFSTSHYVAIFGTLDRANGVLTQLSYLVLFVCVATRIDVQSSERMLHVIVLTAAPICLLGLAQAVGWQPLPLITDARTSLTTTLGRANFTGAYLALLLPLSLTAILVSTDNLRRTAYMLLFACELLVIELTQARAAWIAAVFGMGMLLWLRMAPQWSSRVRWLTILGGFALLTNMVLLIFQRGLLAGDSIAARWTIWQASVRLLWPRLWLGYGADTLELYFPSVYPPQLVYYQGRGVVVDRAHNWLLDWSLSYGIVATFVLTAAIIFILRRGWQRLTLFPQSIQQYQTNSTDESHALYPENVRISIPQSYKQDWLAACMAGICTQLVSNLFLFEVAATSVVFWLLMAIVVAGTTGGDLDTVPSTIPNGIRIVVIVLATSFVSWAIWQSNLRPLLADMYSWRGTQALSQGNPLDALAEYSKAIEQQPRRAAYHVAAALTSAQLGNLAPAERSMRRAVALRPLDPVLYTLLAGIYARESASNHEKIALAYNAFEQAINLAPTIALTYRQYADLALRSGDERIALLQAQRAVDLDATDGVAFGILGWAHLHEGNVVAAQRAFAQAVKWQPDSADSYLGLATANFRNGDLHAANQAVQQSLALDPTYVPARALQLRLEE